MRGRWLLATVIAAAAVVLVHGSSVRGGFVYDDHRFIEYNQAIRHALFAEAFTDPTTASHGDGIAHDIYRPLRTVLYAWQFALFAETHADGGIDFHLGWWHALSVLLHLINTLLVLRLLRSLLRGAMLPALVGALLFAVHPLTSESVAWLSSQGDLLAMTFLLGTLVLFEGRGVGRTVAGVVGFALACLAKESALMLPFLLPLRDLALPRGDDAPPSPWARLTILRTTVLLGVVGLYFAVRAAVLPGLAQVEHVDGSVMATIRAMLAGVGWYAQALLAPLGFTFDTRLDAPLRWTAPEVVIGLGILSTVLVAGVYGLVRRRYLLALACLGVLVSLGPVSNVLVPLKTFVADRFFYPALPCVAVGVGALLAGLGATARAATATVLLAVLAVFGGLTAHRAQAWGDEGSLWQAVMEDRPWNANAYQGLAYELAHRKRVADAERAYATYLQANPLDGKAIYAMGNVMGELAQSLVLLTPGEPGWSETDVTHRLRQRQARVAQIKLYQRAFEIWDRPGGLTLGRGSEEMFQDMLGRWIEAGVALGDLRTAKFANDRLIEREIGQRLDPRASDAPARSWEAASWPRRRARFEFAMRVLQVMRDGKIPDVVRERVVEDRAAILRDVRVDPARSNRDLVGPLGRIAAELVRTGLADERFQPDPLLFVHQAGMALGAEDRAGAIRALRQGLGLWPQDVRLRASLQALGEP